jgi:hypothetical protein
LVSKIRGEKFSSKFFHMEFSCRMSRCTPIPLIVALSPGYSDITRFLPWSLIATENYLGRAEKFQTLLRLLAPLTILIRVQAFRGPTSGQLPHV